MTKDYQSDQGKYDSWEHIEEYDSDMLQLK
jgi:hypothetical protein